MILKLVNKHIFPHPLRYRLWLILMIPVMPFHYVGQAVKELWEDETLPEVYKYMWRAFKEGRPL